MEERLGENQGGVSSVPPLRKIGSFKFFLWGGLGLVVLFLIGGGIYWLKFKRGERKVVSPPTSSFPSQIREQEVVLEALSQTTSAPSSETQGEVFFPSPVSHPQIVLEAPVSKESLTKGKLVQMEYGVNDWSFSLAEGEPVYAAFSGWVEFGGENELQKLIILTSEDGKLIWKYFLTGGLEVKRGQKIGKGDILAKVGKDSLPTYDFNLVIQALWEGKRVSIEEDFLNSFY